VIQLRFIQNITNQKRFHFTFFGKEPIKSAEELPDKLEYDYRLVRTRHGQSYLFTPKKHNKYNGPL
jgi:hypothetical protein